MEIRINKQWVIYTSKNGAGVILGKIPENKQDDPELDVNKLGGNNLHHYATVFGAVQGLFKYGVNDTDAKSFAELEAKIERIAQECQTAFIKAQSAPVVPEGYVLVKASDRDREMLELIDQRDHMESQAEELKDKLQALYGVDFGEHSNCNFPFQNAIDFDDSDFVLVLKEPNEEMIISGLAVVATGIGKHNIDEEIRKIWEKMIEAQEKGNAE